MNGTTNAKGMSFYETTEEKGIARVFQRPLENGNYKGEGTNIK